MERARAVREPRGDVRGVFVFALLAAFALLSLAVVLVGARAYRAINQTSDETHVSRTGMSYLLGKVRGADAEGAVAILEENGADVRMIKARYPGLPVVTYVNTSAAVKAPIACSLTDCPPHATVVPDRADWTWARYG